MSIPTRPATILVPLVTALALAACGGGESNSRGGDLTPQEFASRFQSALKKDGQVIHSTSTLTADVDGEKTVLLEAESWVDMSRGLRRHQYDVVNEIPNVSGSIPPRQIIVINGDEVTSGDGRGNYENELQLCKDWTQCEEWYSTFFDSLMGLGPAFPEEFNFNPRVESSIQYEERAATALVHSWSYPLGYEMGFLDAEEGTVEFKSSFYVEEETFLPIAWVVDYQFVDSERKGSFVATFDNEFVAAETLPQYLFDPKSVSPEGKTVLTITNLGIDVYWLGQKFQTEGLPLLSLSGAGPTPGRQPYGGSVQLTYESSEFGGHGVVVESWRPADWDDDPGSQRAGGEETNIDGHRAILFDLEDSVLAHVYFPNAVVSVFAEPRGGYTSREAMEALVRGLRLHNPGE